MEIIYIVSRMNENGEMLQELKLNEENLSKIMEHNNVKDNVVMIVSIAGALRKGKSFLLGFFLKYLEAEVNTYKIFLKNALNKKLSIYLDFFNF